MLGWLRTVFSSIEKTCGIMAGNDKKSSGKQTHADDGLVQHSTSICKERTTAVSQIPGVTSRSLRSNLKLVPLFQGEINHDNSKETDKSSKSSPKKRNSLKVGKSNKKKVSPYATRSLSGLSILRNGKKKFDFSLLQLGRRQNKRKVNTDNASPVTAEDGNDELKLRRSTSPILGPKIIKRRHFSDNETPSKITDCTIETESLESSVSLDNTEDELMSDGKDSVDTITLDSLPSSSPIIPEIVSDDKFDTEEKAEEEKPNVNVDNSSPFKILSALKDNIELENSNSTSDELLVRKELDDSCELVFDISNCQNYLQPVSVGSRGSNGVKDSVGESEDSFTERLYLSESSISPEKEVESSHSNSESKLERCSTGESEDSFTERLYLSESSISSEKEVQPSHSISESKLERCSTESSCEILSTENSESSISKCISSIGNANNSTSLQNSIAEKVSEPKTPTVDSVSLSAVEESVSSLDDNVVSVDDPTEQVIVLDSECDSKSSDEKRFLEAHDETDNVKDVSVSNQVLEESSINVVDGKEGDVESKDNSEVTISLDSIDSNSSNNSCNLEIVLGEDNGKSLGETEELAASTSDSENNLLECTEIENCDTLNENIKVSSESTIEESVVAKEVDVISDISADDIVNNQTLRSKDDFTLKYSIRTSLADIVKKGLLNLSDTDSPVSIVDEVPPQEEPDDKLIIISSSNSPITATEKDDEIEEIVIDRVSDSEKSCNILVQQEAIENESTSEEVQLIDSQEDPSSTVLDQRIEEKVSDFSMGASVCEPQGDHVNTSSAEVSPENCKQQKDEETKHPSEEGKDVTASSKEPVDVSEDSAERLAIKETILNALGLQSSKAALIAKNPVRQGLPPIPSRTSGTLKTIIKVPRMADKRRARNRVKLVLKNDKDGTDKEKPSSMNDQRFVSAEERECMSRDPVSLSFDQQTTDDALSYRIFNESCMSTIEPWSADITKQRSKSQGNGRRYMSNDPMSQLDLNRLNFSRNSVSDIGSSSSIDFQPKPNQDLDQNVVSDGSSNSGRSSQQGSSEGTGEPNLVIPEKIASFSIHPERLCHDVCCYCFGKFGSLDTPMHIAQMKGEDKRRAALTLESHLSMDSCLCDACYRFLDRKSSCPSYQPYRRQSGVSGGILTKPQVCCVRGCSLPAHHLVRRKWLTRLKRTISKLLPLELTPLPPHQQHSLHAPLCSRHFYCLEYYSMCGICKRKLSRNNMHPVGREVHALNSVLLDDSIPVTLTGKIFLCKMCRYYSGIRLKYRDKKMLSSGHKTFFDGYRRRIWHYLGIQKMDSSEISAPIEIPKKRKKSKSTEGDSCQNAEQSKLFKRADGPSRPSIESTSESSSETNAYKPYNSTLPTKIRFKLGNVSIEHLDNADPNKKGSKTQIPETVTQSGSQKKPETSKPKKRSYTDSAVKSPEFPGVDQLGLNASFIFHGNDNEKNNEWEKCTTTIQFDSKTKKLWQSLYYPYGNFSSFIRHLVIMERNWRNGDLILAPSASSQAVNYVNSVQNRIAAYEGSATRLPPRSTLPKHSSTKETVPKPVSSKPAPVKAISVPHKVTKDPLPSLPTTVSPRITFTAAQCPTNITAPITAQLIPINTTTKFLPLTPSQFISFGNPSSYIQIGRAPGLVHQISNPYPCVQLNQEAVSEKGLMPKALEINERATRVIAAPVSSTVSSSSSNFDPHISNVRSLADDAGNSNWESQPEKQAPANKDLILSETNDKDKHEEQQMSSISVVPVASLAVVSTPPVKISDKSTQVATPEGSNSTEINPMGNLFKAI